MSKNSAFQKHVSHASFIEQNSIEILLQGFVNDVTCDSRSYTSSSQLLPCSISAKHDVASLSYPWYLSKPCCTSVLSTLQPADEVRRRKGRKKNNSLNSCWLQAFFCHDRAGAPILVTATQVMLVTETALVTLDKVINQITNYIGM